MTVRDALAERFAIMAANAEGAPADQEMEEAKQLMRGISSTRRF